MARRSKKLKMSAGAMHARAKFEEAKHKRDIAGKFADKPGTEKPGAGGAPGKGASKDQWTAAAKTSGVTGEDQIKLHVTSNPKKAGSASAERFAKYQDGMTTKEFLASGGMREDLAWDRKKGFITIHDPPTYQKLSSGQAAQNTADINPVGATGRLASIKGGGEPPAAPKAAAAPAGKPAGSPAQPAGATVPKTTPAEPAAPAAAKATTETVAPTAAKPPKETSFTSTEKTDITSGATKPLKAPEGEKVTDTYVTSEKPLKVELPKPKPLDYKFKAEELTPLPQTSMADESDAGLKWEYEVEYIKYGGRQWGPGINSQEDFNKRYKAAPLTYLTDDQYNTLGYTTINMNNLPTHNDVHKMIGHRRDPKAIRERMFTGITTPPIVLRKNGKLRLMAGQSRIFTGFGAGFRVPVKVLDV